MEKQTARPLSVLLGGACLLAPTLFVAPASRAPALRAAPQQGAAAPQAGSAAGSVLGLSAVGVVAAAAAVKPSRKRTTLAASIMADAEGEAAPAEEAATEKKAPPPPPPFDPAKQVGVTAPLGFFDPLGFTKVGDRDGFRKLRAAEIKHGRVAMMAAAGAVIQHFARIPIFFDYLPSGLSAAWTSNGKYGMVFLLIGCGFLELFQWTERDDKEPGDFGDPIGLGIYDRDMRNRELNNGRFAMFASMGIIAGELVTGKDALEQVGFGPSMFM